uniref:Calmodulin binding transcription activator 2 n=1 Tax=Neogobius melanostomus TaxID=47308 RepID=A0A8C6SM76_9GOBI
MTLPERGDSPQPLSPCPPVDVAALAEQIIEATPERIKQRGGQPGPSGHLVGHVPGDGGPAPSPVPALPAQRSGPASPSPASSAAWAEFLNASANGKIERDFALLTLTDGEQRELYEAARIIQTAFRRYKYVKGIFQDVEAAGHGAAVIQRCYRKYKQYALYKKMTQAAILIQSKFRSYYEQKRFHYKEYERKQRTAVLPEGSFLTKKQDQAARKIMRFLRRCRHRYTTTALPQESERRPQPGGAVTSTL